MQIGTFTRCTQRCYFEYQ